MKPKIVIIEGAQGCGKTTITNWLREQMPFTNLMRMSGHRFIDSDGRDKSMTMYGLLCRYLEDMGRARTDMNFVFDRIFVSDIVYSMLGYRNYTLPVAELIDDYHSLNRYYDVTYITLYVGDSEIIKERLNRDKFEVEYSKFDVESSIRQQNAYLDMHSLMKNSFKSYVVDSSRPLDVVKNEIWEILVGKNLIEPIRHTI